MKNLKLKFVAFDKAVRMANAGYVYSLSLGKDGVEEMAIEGALVVFVRHGQEHFVPLSNCNIGDIIPLAEVPSESKPRQRNSGGSSSPSK